MLIKFRKILAVFMGTVLLVVLGLAGSIAWDIRHIFRDGDLDYEFIDEPEGDVTPPPPEDVLERDVEWEDDDDEDEEEEVIRYKPDPDRVNILLIGIDKGGRRGPLSDTIMIFSFHKERGEPVLISLPRDTYVMIPGRYKDKINHSHAFGGATLLRQTVEGFTGIPIDYYLRVNMEGFVKIVDLIGGVEITVERQMGSLQPGTQVLNGEQALRYVRDRNHPRGDFARIEQQQRFLQAAARQVQQSALHKLPALIREGVKYVDTDMPLGTLLDFANRFSDKDPNSITRYVVTGRGFMYNGVYYLRANEAAMHRFLNQHMRIITE